MMHPFGPWSPTVKECELKPQLRTLQTLVHSYCGYDALVRRLREAEQSPAALEDAGAMFDDLPPLTRRKILSTFTAITWPR
jgi:hypothetical protein